MKYLSAYEKRELARLSETMKNVELARKYGVCEDTVVRILKRLRDAGISLPYRKTGKGRYKVRGII